MAGVDWEGLGGWLEGEGFGGRVYRVFALAFVRSPLFLLLLFFFPKNDLVKLVFFFQMRV